ncbi:hypothetical protein QBC39DRAFT_337362 [Podospora conica]|nr:hypothetical protein QBC39DRAFT_337362 [Schizothecium conicum]
MPPKKNVKKAAPATPPRATSSKALIVTPPPRARVPSTPPSAPRTPRQLRSNAKDSSPAASPTPTPSKVRKTPRQRVSESPAPAKAQPPRKTKALPKTQAQPKATSPTETTTVALQEKKHEPTSPAKLERPRKKQRLASPQPQRPLDGHPFDFDATPLPKYPSTPLSPKARRVTRLSSQVGIHKKSVRPPRRKQLVPDTPTRKSLRLMEKIQEALPTAMELDSVKRHQERKKIVLEAIEEAMDNESPGRRKSKFLSPNGFLQYQNTVFPFGNPPPSSFLRERRGFRLDSAGNIVKRIKSPTYGDPMVVDSGHQWQRRPTPSPTSPEILVIREDGRWVVEQRRGDPGAWQSRFPEDAEHPSPRRTFHPRKAGKLVNGMANLGEDSDDEDLEEDEVKRIQTFRTMLGPRWARRPMTDLMEAIIAAEFRGLNREKAVLARAEARAKALRRKDRARIAKPLGMQRRPFADDHGRVKFGEQTKMDRSWWSRVLRREAMDRLGQKYSDSMVMDGDSSRWTKERGLRKKRVEVEDEEMGEGETETEEDALVDKLSRW